MTFEEWIEDIEKSATVSIELRSPRTVALLAWKAATEAERNSIADECKRMSEEADELAATCSDDDLNAVIAQGVAAHQLEQAIRARGNDGN